MADRIADGTLDEADTWQMQFSQNLLSTLNFQQMLSPYNLGQYQ